MPRMTHEYLFTVRELAPWEDLDRTWTEHFDSLAEYQRFQRYAEQEYRRTVLESLDQCQAEMDEHGAGLEPLQHASLHNTIGQLEVEIEMFKIEDCLKQVMPYAIRKRLEQKLENCRTALAIAEVDQKLIGYAS